MQLPDHFPRVLRLAEIALTGLEKATNGSTNRDAMAVDYIAWEALCHVRLLIRWLDLGEESAGLTFGDLTAMETGSNPTGHEAAAGLLYIACHLLRDAMDTHDDWDADGVVRDLAGVLLGLDAAKGSLESYVTGGPVESDQVAVAIAAKLGIPFAPRERPIWKQQS